MFTIFDTRNDQDRSHHIIWSFLLATTGMLLINGLVFASDTKEIFNKAKGMVVTVEVYGKLGGVRRALGSGYFVSRHGDLLTNYHVIADHLQHPDLYRLQVLVDEAPRNVHVVRFDLIHDLALLRMPSLKSTPFTFARVPVEEKGVHLYSLGNPEALGMSIVEGIYNGPKPKEMIPQMNVTAPVNAGMSGGPILNEAGEVVGMNVSGLVDTDLLNFGIPLSSIKNFLKELNFEGAVPTLKPDNYGTELARQMRVAEDLFSQRFIGDLEKAESAKPTSRIGPFQLPKLPDFIECGLTRDEVDQYGIGRKTVHCRSEGFYVDDKHPLNRISLMFKYVSADIGAIPFFSFLGRASNVDGLIRPESSIKQEYFPDNCVSSRVREGKIVWLMNACTNRSRSYPDVIRYTHTATSVDRQHSGFIVTLLWTGISSELRRKLVRHLFKNVKRIDP